MTIHSDPTVVRLDDHDTIRIGNTRVTLDTLVAQFNSGETPERISENFPTLNLADIFSALAYYLRHRAEVDEYIRQGELKFEEFRKTHPEMFALEQTLRERAKARMTSNPGRQERDRRACAHRCGQ